LKTGLTRRIYEENIQYNTKIPARNRIKLQYVDWGNDCKLATVEEVGREGLEHMTKFL
jgi:hypothetical protein